MLRLIDHLRELQLNNRQIRDGLESGKVFYYDAPTSDGSRMVDPQFVRYRVDAPRIVMGRDIAIIHKDADLAVVFKPAGLLSVAARGRGREPNLVSLMAKRFGAAHPVHRLDEGTSGLMIVALSNNAKTLLKEMFFEHAIERHYLALVRHVFPPTPRRVENMMVRNRGDGKRGSPGEDMDEEEGRVAITHLRLVEALRQDASVVEARLETGRTHQVRIHLAEAGYPILGDGLYGGPGIERAFRRVALHSTRITFEHPITGKKIDKIAPLADDLEQFRRKLSAPRGQNFRG